MSSGGRRVHTPTRKPQRASSAAAAVWLRYIRAYRLRADMTLPVSKRVKQFNLDTRERSAFEVAERLWQTMRG